MAPLTMCFASCSHYPSGFFTAYRAIAADDPDLVLHLGDYQYEGTSGANAVRQTAGPETVTWPATGNATPSTRLIPTCRSRMPPPRGSSCGTTMSWTASCRR